MIEKLMLEDLHSATVAPGMPVPHLCARAWVEFRSKIGAYRSSAYAAWSTAGILDSLIQGNVKKARARAAVLLLMLDQASIDKGNWTLAAGARLGTCSTFLEPGNAPASIGDGRRASVQQALGQQVARGRFGSSQRYRGLPHQAEEPEQAVWQNWERNQCRRVIRCRLKAGRQSQRPSQRAKEREAPQTHRCGKWRCMHGPSARHGAIVARLQGLLQLGSSLSF